MNTKFNRQHWIEELKKEIGLPNTPYEELHEHFISFGLFNTDTKISAKEYVDNQLKNLEDSFNSISEQLDDDIGELYESTLPMGSSKPTGEFVGSIQPQLIQLPEIKQNIERGDIKYFDVVVDGNNLTVAVNANKHDFKTTDYINHIKATSCFIEERNPNSLTGFETIISYFQFANMMQSQVRKQSTDLSAYDKISKDINTVFDGIKLEGF